MKIKIEGAEKLLYKMDRVMAGIVTYNPDADRFKENLSAICKQVNYIYIVDNGSTNINVVEEIVSNIDNVKIEVKRFGHNLGIAVALKEIMNWAFREEIEWVLTLDQDSIVQPGLVDCYLKAANKFCNNNVGMFTCLIKDRNFEDLKYEVQEEEYKEVPCCITSAAFVNVDKYFKTQGYDDSFFIDAVDFDICYTLRDAGYVIYRINYIGLYHEVGHGENRNFFGKRIVVYHQKPLRVYYLARNLIKMHKKHKKNFPFVIMLKMEVALLIRIVCYEEGKMKKLRAFFNGILNKEAYMRESND